MKRICAYNYKGVPITELNNYSKSWLNGYAPVIVIDDLTDVSIPDNYIEITNIEAFCNYGRGVGLSHFEIRNNVAYQYDLQGNNWGSLTNNEKKKLAQLFLVDKNQRDEVLTQEEQDFYNHFKIYHFLSNDVLRKHLINDLIDLKETPKSIDYKKDVNQRLHPEYYFDNNGFLYQVIYYESVQVGTDQFGFPTYAFSNPIVKYEAQYTVDSDGYTSDRFVTRSWCMMDETWSDDTKVTYKIYDRVQSRDEAFRRRSNLISQLIIKTIGLLLMTSPDLTSVNEAESDAMPFYRSIESAISLYKDVGAVNEVDGSPFLLKKQIAEHTYTRLDNEIPGSGGVTIRMFLLAGIEP